MKTLLSLFLCINILQAQTPLTGSTSGLPRLTFMFSGSFTKMNPGSISDYYQDVYYLTIPMIPKSDGSVDVTLSGKSGNVTVSPMITFSVFYRPYLDMYLFRFVHLVLLSEEKRICLSMLQLVPQKQLS